MPGYLDVDHLPESPEVLTGDLPLPPALLTGVHQTPELWQSLRQHQPALTNHTTDQALQ